MSYFSEIGTKYALVQPNNSGSGQNVVTASNGTLTSTIKSGPGSGAFALEVVVQSHDTAGFIACLGKGQNSNHHIALVFTSGGDDISLKLAGTAGGPTSYYHTIAKSAKHVTQRIFLYADLAGGAGSLRSYVNGQLYATDTLTANTINNITEEFTFFNREDVAGAGGQHQGFITSYKLWYLSGTLTAAQANADARSLANGESTSNLDGLVIHVEPDATDAATTVVRNQASGQSFNFSIKGECKTNQVKGHNTTAWWLDGQTSGGLQYFRTTNAPVFEPLRSFWEVRCRPDIITSQHVLMGDENNYLYVDDTAGTDTVKFVCDAGGTPATATSPAITSTEDLYACSFSDGTNIYAGANGVFGSSATDAATMASGTEFSLGCLNDGTLTTRGSFYGHRVMLFDSGQVPSVAQMKQIIMYQCVHWPDLHPIIEAKRDAGTVQIVHWNNLVETTTGNWAWQATSTNTTIGNHDMFEWVGSSDRALYCGPVDIMHHAVYIGDPTGTDGDSETLGTAANPYTTSSAISNAIAAADMEKTEYILTGYDYKTNGTQNVTFGVAGMGCVRTKLTGTSTDTVNYISTAALNDIQIDGNGMQVSRATSGDNVAGSGARVEVAGVISRDAASSGNGFVFSGANTTRYNCISIGNNGAGWVDTGATDPIYTNCITTGNTGNACTGVASGISDYNLWDGTVTLMSTGSNDDTTNTPTFTDAANDVYTPKAGDPQIDTGTELTYVAAHNEMGPFEYVPAAVKGFLVGVGVGLGW